MPKQPKLEIPENVRAYADQSVTQAKTAFEDFMKAVHEAAGKADVKGSELHAGAKQVNDKMLELTEDNISAAFDLAQKLVNAKEPSEIMQLQMAYFQGRMAALGSQSQEFQEQLVKSMSGLGGGSKTGGRG